MSGSWSNPAQQVIVLPSGAVSGERIVLDGVNGLIEVYNSADVLVARIEALPTFGGFWSRNLAPSPVMTELRGAQLVADLVNAPVDGQGVLGWASLPGARNALWQILSGNSTAAQVPALLRVQASSALLARPLVDMTDGSGGPCDVTLTGILTAGSRITGTTQITPSGAGTPTSKAITFPAPLEGTTFTCQVTALTAAPGTVVLGCSYSALSDTGVTLWLTRSDTSPTTLSYTAEGIA